MSQVDPLVARVQSFLRENARRQYEAIPLPPFTLFFHPGSTLKYFNYAIPDVPTGGDLTSVLFLLRAEFLARRRTPRLEFFEAFAPNLPDSLRAGGFVEEARQWSMVCTPDTFRPAQPVEGLEIVELSAESPDEDFRQFISTQRSGFSSEDAAEPDQNDITQSRLDALVGGWRFLLGRYQGRPAGAAVYSSPLDGASEVAGIATRVEFRQRGIGSALSAQATENAFRLGAQIACLTAEDERAGRVYERIGFRPFSIMLAYIEPESK